MKHKPQYYVLRQTGAWLKDGYTYQEKPEWTTMIHKAHVFPCYYHALDAMMQLSKKGKRSKLFPVDLTLKTDEAGEMYHEIRRKQD